MSTPESRWPWRYRLGFYLYFLGVCVVAGWTVHSDPMWTRMTVVALSVILLTLVAVLLTPRPWPLDDLD